MEDNTEKTVAPSTANKDDKKIVKSVVQTVEVYEEESSDDFIEMDNGERKRKGKRIIGIPSYLKNVQVGREFEKRLCIPLGEHLPMVKKISDEERNILKMLGIQDIRVEIWQGEKENGKDWMYWEMLLKDGDELVYSKKQALNNGEVTAIQLFIRQIKRDKASLK